MKSIEEEGRMSTNEIEPLALAKSRMRVVNALLRLGPGDNVRSRLLDERIRLAGIIERNTITLDVPPALALRT